jgi:hypothetical protein
MDAGGQGEAPESEPFELAVGGMVDDLVDAVPEPVERSQDRRVAVGGRGQPVELAVGGLAERVEQRLGGGQPLGRQRAGQREAEGPVLAIPVGARQVSPRRCRSA